MKHFLLTPSLLFTLHAVAQAPERMSYQAVVRNDANALVTNNTVGMRLSIVQGSASGTAIYVETHSTATNANGLATVQVGGGTVVSGSMTGIDWGTGPYFLKTETDPAGGGNFSVTGTSELLSVPYALYSANNAPGPAGPPGMPGVGGCEPNDRDSLIVLYNATLAHGFYQDPLGAGHWVQHTLGGTNHYAIGSKRSTLIYNSSNAHAFYLDNTGTGQWSTGTIGGTNHTAVSADRSVVLYNNANAYAFHVDGGGAGTWTTQAIGGTGHSHIAYGDKIVVWNNNNAWTFSVDANGSGTWVAETLGGTIHNVITTK